MQKGTVYILHKHGASSHYNGLNRLLREHDSHIKFREFSIFGTAFKSLLTLRINKFIKQFVNAGFLLQLLFTKGKKVVLGIAPYDSELRFLLYFLKSHKIYYHTSWTYWDQSFYPKHDGDNERVFNVWRSFIETKVQHIFSVTQQSKNQIIANYKVSPERVSVVYHSIAPIFYEELKAQRFKNSFIYYGRLVPQKGIDELLTYFSKNQSYQLTIIGNGDKEKLVREYSLEHSNITYKPATNNKKELIEDLSCHEFLILNSKRTKKWEELFGLVIIESMAQGLIPISTNHSGPKEIISSNFGYLFKEGDLNKTLDKVIEDGFDTTKSNTAKKQSKLYTLEEISARWTPILE